MCRRPFRSVRPGLAVVLVLILASSGRCRAELLYFKAGGCLDVPASVREGLVRIETASGPVMFRASDFVRIVPAADPEAAWPARREAAMKGDVQARLAAAWWALENGLVEPCETMIEAASACAPDDRRAARLATLVRQLRHTPRSPDTSAIRAALGTSLEEIADRNVMLLHQHGADVARARLVVLERIVSAYYLMFAFYGLDLPVPREQLVSVYLRDRETYQRFLETQNAGAFRSTQGFYHPTFRVVLAYDLCGSTRGVESAAVALTPAERIAGRLGGDADRRRLLRSAEATAYDLGTASHEMIHLLVHVSGLDDEPRRFPCWLHEGLATQFEVYRGDRWAGISPAHDLRLADLRALEHPPELSLLIRDVGFGHGYRKDLYAGSWALVCFLRKERAGELMAFIDLLRNPDSREGDPGGDRYQELFEQVFGRDLPRLEQEWQQHLSRLQTPSEFHAADSR
jgi:hypothetical protein